MENYFCPCSLFKTEKLEIVCNFLEKSGTTVCVQAKLKSPKEEQHQRQRARRNVVSRKSAISFEERFKKEYL